MLKALAFIVTATTCLALQARAELVIYKTKTHIKNVDCANSKATIQRGSSHHLTTLDIRKTIDPAMLEDWQRKENWQQQELRRICAKLTEFSNSNKTLTVLTTPTQTAGDFIEKEELIGVIDDDMFEALTTTAGNDEVDVKFCGTVTRGSQVCEWRAQASHHVFLSEESVSDGEIMFYGHESTQGSAREIKASSGDQEIDLKVRTASDGQGAAQQQATFVVNTIALPPFIMRDMTPKFTSPRF